MNDSTPGYANTTVAVTGGFGYIGSALCEALRQTAARILLVGRRTGASLAGATTITADIQDAACWSDLVNRADIIFHLAGNTSVPAADRDPAASLTSTVLPLAHLAAAARDARRRIRVVYASTATVYGLTERNPVAEHTDVRPITTYDLHKWFAEQQLDLASRQSLVEGVSLRLANVYGPSPGSSAAADRGVLNRLAALARDGREILVYGGGRPVRDYVYIDDVVRAFLTAGVHPRLTAGAFNVGSGTGTTVRDALDLLATRAARVTGRRSPLRDVPWPVSPHPIESRNFVADVGRIADTCGWRPEVPLTDGLDRLVRALAGPADAECVQERRGSR